MILLLENICILLELIVYHALPGSNALPLCSDVTVRGSKYATINGDYTLTLNDPCANSYTQISQMDQGSSNYLYYGDNGWNIGPQACSPLNRYAICEKSSAYSPFDYNTPCVWKEKEPSDFSFTYNNKLMVSCTSNIERKTPSAVSVGIVVSILCTIFLILLICAMSVIAVKKKIRNNDLTRSAERQQPCSLRDPNCPPNYLESSICPANLIVTAPKYEDLYPDSVPPNYNEVVKNQWIQAGPVQSQVLSMDRVQLTNLVENELTNDNCEPPSYSNVRADHGLYRMDGESQGHIARDPTISSPPQQAEAPPTYANSAIKNNDNGLNTDDVLANSCSIMISPNNHINKQSFDNPAFTKDA